MRCSLLCWRRRAPSARACSSGRWAGVCARRAGLTSCRLTPPLCDGCGAALASWRRGEPATRCVVRAAAVRPHHRSLARSGCVPGHAARDRARAEVRAASEPRAAARSTSSKRRGRRPCRGRPSRPRSAPSTAPSPARIQSGGAARPAPRTARGRGARARARHVVADVTARGAASPQRPRRVCRDGRSRWPAVVSCSWTM